MIFSGVNSATKFVRAAETYCNCTSPLATCILGAKRGSFCDSSKPVGSISVSLKTDVNCGVTGGFFWKRLRKNVMIFAGQLFSCMNGVLYRDASNQNGAIQYAFKEAGDVAVYGSCNASLYKRKSSSHTCVPFMKTRAR